MNKKVVFLYVILLVVSVITGCKTSILQADVESEDFLVSLSSNAIIAYQNYTVDERQQSLDHLAQIFAKVINKNKNVRHMIGEEVGKQFDGDYEVLYEAIASRTFEGKSLRALLQVEANNATQLASMVPYFNIAIPVNYDKWSTYEDEVYVIPMRYDIDDMEIDSLYGYDSMGNKVAFSAEVEPEYPVIVLGINERVTLMQATEKQQEPMNVLYPMTAGDGLTVHKVIFENIRLIDDHEPWYSGNAEVYAFWVSGYNDKEVFKEYANIDHDKTDYYINQVIWSLNDLPQYEYFKVEFWELDTGSRALYSVLDNYISTWDGKDYALKGVFSSYWAPDDDLIGDEMIRLDYKNLAEFTFDDVEVMVLGKSY